MKTRSGELVQIRKKQVREQIYQNELDVRSLVRTQLREHRGLGACVPGLFFMRHQQPKEGTFVKFYRHCAVILALTGSITACTRNRKHPHRSRQPAARQTPHHPQTCRGDDRLCRHQQQHPQGGRSWPTAVRRGSPPRSSTTTAKSPEFAQKCGWPVDCPTPLPGSILPQKRIVAYYGNPLSKKMGALGEFPKDEMLQKLKGEAARWQAADPATPVQPALHLIAVVAQGSPRQGGQIPHDHAGQD